MIVGRAALRFKELPGRSSADPFGDAAARCSVRVVRLEAGRPRSPHRHPHCEEAIYVVAGTGLLWENGAVRAVEAGDLVLIQAGVAHATIPEKGTQMELVSFFPHPDLASNIEELDDVVIVEKEGAGE